MGPGVRRRRHSVLVDDEVLLAAVAVSVGEESLKVHKEALYYLSCSSNISINVVVVVGVQLLHSCYGGKQFFQVLLNCTHQHFRPDLLVVRVVPVVVPPLEPGGARRVAAVLRIRVPHGREHLLLDRL